MQFIDLKAQYDSIREEVHKRIEDVLDGGQYILGNQVTELEQRLAAYVGTRHCICVSSGTDALLISLMALGVGAGDEVITSPFTFIATAEVIALLGAKPVFVDIDPQTYNLDAALLEGAIGKDTKAILAVSLYGQCADLNAINELASKYGLPVVEDGAQSFGATHHGQRSCGLTDIGCTSFFPSKPLGGYGDGGAIFTNSESQAEKIRQIRVHGQDRRYHHARLGVNGRLDTLQAAIVLAKLDIFDRELEARARVAEVYDGLLAGTAIEPPFVRAGNVSVYAQYTVQVSNRELVRESMVRDNIPTAVHYPIPLYRQPALAQDEVKLTNAERAAQRVLSLPMHPYLARNEQEKVVASLLRACNDH